MSEARKRVEDELEELGVRLNKLTTFIGSSKVFKGLPIEDQNLLKSQQVTMQSYAYLLQQRLNRWTV